MEAPLTPNESNTEVSVPRIAPAPFNKPSAEIILRTADNVDFYVRRAILEEASSTFADMTSFPQPPPVNGSAEGAAHVVLLTEPSEIIEPLLRVCYPVPDPEFSSLDELKPVLEATRKYQMDSVLQALARPLVQLSCAAPLPAYAIALQFGLDDAARGAAKLSLKYAPPWPFTKELEHVSGAAYYRLLVYRQKCVLAAKSTIYGVDLCWLDEGTFCWFTCQNSSCALSSGKFYVKASRELVYGATWFKRHLERVLEFFSTTPCREALDRPGLSDQTIRDAAVCFPCRAVISRDLRWFTLKLGNEVEKRVNKVILEIGST
ncbi:hypothetical protein OH77DRAFT_1428690 [Trametes cingulata]|nr:hypothetical protein OH77DRAFT_1428690 [Trametes cingulata]